MHKDRFISHLTRSTLVRIFFASILYWCIGAAHALTAEQVKAMAIGDTESRVQALAKAAAEPDEKTAAFIQALADDAVKTAGAQVLVVQGSKAIDPVTGAEVPLPADAEDVINNNLMRGELDNVLAALALFSKDEKRRRQAIKTLAGDNDEARLPLIEKAYAAETVPALKSQLELLRAAILLGSSDQAKRLQAASLLAASGDPSTKTVLLERLKSEADPQVKAALQSSLRSVEATLAWGDKLAAVFSAPTASWASSTWRMAS
jgi:urea transport system permease protein